LEPLVEHAVTVRPAEEVAAAEVSRYRGENRVLKARGRGLRQPDMKNQVHGRSPLMHALITVWWERTAEQALVNASSKVLDGPIVFTVNRGREALLEGIIGLLNVAR